ncbi:MAG: hypothetical protein D3925_01190 [Candidatus Electrothrix sp. AR5]|nr:hypothetical protein [Candidatus Electrothrix sp. AR5]
MKIDKVIFNRILPLLSILLWCGGCGIIPKQLGRLPEDQVMVIDKNGRLMKPVGNLSDGNTYISLLNLKDEISYQKERNYIQNKIVQGIAGQLSLGKDVVFFIHGGMNLQVDSMERAHNLLSYTKEQEKQGKEIPHFVFVNWQSSLTTSYWDRLFGIREGEKYYRDRGWFYERGNDLAGLFLYFPSDLLSGLARSPITLERQFVTFFSNSSLGNLPKDIMNAELNAVNQDLVHTIETENQSDLLRTIPSTLTSPFRIITTPLVDTFGVHAWDVMQRRTQILFSREYPDDNGDSRIPENA